MQKILNNINVNLDGTLGICKWTEDDNNSYDTDCGERFEITTGTPAENDMKFCAFCGKNLKGIKYEDEDTDE